MERLFHHDGIIISPMFYSQTSRLERHRFLPSVHCQNRYNLKVLQQQHLRSNVIVVAIAIIVVAIAIDM